MRRPALLLVPVLVLALISVGLVSAATITGTTSGTVVWESPDGPTVQTENVDVTDSVPIRQSAVDLGHTRFAGSGEATLADSGLSTNEITVTALDSGSGELVVNRSGLQAVGLDGTASSLTVRPVDTDAELPEIELSGATGTLRVTGLAPTSGFVVLRDGAISQFNETDGNGNLNLSVSGDETLSIRSPQPPELTNASPAANEAIDQDPVPLQVDVDWEVFGLDPNAQLHLTWELNGQQVATGALTTAGTATIDVNESDGLQNGGNSWTLTATDPSGGAPSETVSEQFRVPNVLEIRDELNPGSLVNNSTVELTFFGEDDTVITRSAADGTVDMSGLPLSQSFSVSADAPGFVGRTTFVPSILEQQRVFLLNSSATSTVETQFSLTDPTGQFSGEGSRVEIRKALEINGTTEFRTIVGDRLGSAAFSTVLEQGGRYGITVFDGEGNTRELGPYEATSAQLVDLEIDGVQLGGDEDFTDSGGVSVSAQFLNQTLPSIQTVIEPDSNVTVDRAEYRIYPRGNESAELANETIINLQGTLSERVAIPERIDRPDLKTFVFEFTVVVDGETIEGSELIGAKQAQVGFPGIPTTILHAVGMGLILLVGGLFSQANVGVGAIATSLVAGGLWFMGVLPPEVSGIAIALALLLGVMTFVRSRGRTPTP